MDFENILNVLGYAILIIILGTVLVLSFLWSYFSEKYSKEEKDSREKLRKEKKEFSEKIELERKILEQEIKGANLSKVQISTLVAIDRLLEKYPYINCSGDAFVLISRIENILSRFVSKKEDSPFVKERLIKIYEKLMNTENENSKVLISLIAADFARKHNL